MRLYSLPPRILVLPGALLLLALAAGPARGDTSVMLADGRTLEKVELKPGPAPDQVVLESPGTAPVTTPIRELLAVDFGKLAGRALAPTVRMANGDQLYGKVTFPAPRQVRIAAGWGSLTVPLVWCSALRLDEKAELPGAVKKDTVVTKNDRAEGEIQGIKDGKVMIDLGSGPIGLPMDRVLSLALAPRERPAADAAGGVVLAIDLGGGERLTGRWAGLTADILKVKLDWGETLDIPIASLSRLEVKNGKLVYLSDMQPGEVRQIPYLDGSFPFKVDRSVSGGPLRIGGKTFRRGLGTHSRSELTYTLDGNFQSFMATLGIDATVGGQGSVVYRVYGDEKLLYESPVVRGGDPPVEAKVDVKRVLLLRLEVDYADNGDVADHANWGDARLLRQ